MTPTMSPLTSAERRPSLEGLDVLVLGLGRSGQAAAALAEAHGAAVTGIDVDDRQPPALAEGVAAFLQKRDPDWRGK